MNTSDVFKEFLGNLVIQNKDEISGRYKTITKALNKKFWNNESETANSLQIGSYGRKTAVNGISDLDMIFELSDDDFKKYNTSDSNGQLKVLQDIKDAINATYSTTEIKVDRYVVAVNFTNYVVEVCPVFLQADKKYKFPDSYNGGSWKKTNPRP
jgi:tRNA nucleotidyltransferase (CCA-adding enzyme)